MATPESNPPEIRCTRQIRIVDRLGRHSRAPPLRTARSAAHAHNRRILFLGQLTIRLITPLRDDALEAELAGVREDGGAVTPHVFAVYM
jgi:hypothetical protein